MAKLGVEPSRTLFQGRPELDIPPCYEYIVGGVTPFDVHIRAKRVQSPAQLEASLAAIAKAREQRRQRGSST